MSKSNERILTAGILIAVVVILISIMWEPKGSQLAGELDHLRLLEKAHNQIELELDWLNSEGLTASVRDYERLLVLSNDILKAHRRRVVDLYIQSEPSLKNFVQSVKSQ